jgi:hypothetical protein
MDMPDVVIKTAGRGEFRQQRLRKAEAYLRPLVRRHGSQGKAVCVSRNFIYTVVPDR